MNLNREPTSGSQWGDRKVSRTYYNSRRIQLKQPKNISIDLIREALSFIPADLPRSEWIKIGMALKSEFPDAFHLFDEWSKGGNSYNSKDVHSTWKSIKSIGGITIGTLLRFAQDNGFNFKDNRFEQHFRVTKYQKAQSCDFRENNKKEIQDTAIRSQKVWANAKPAQDDHPYLRAKNIAGKGLAEVGGDNFHIPNIIRNEGRFLVIPLHDIFGNIWSIQFISESGKKAFIQGKQQSGIFFRIGEESNLFWIVEGVATGLAFHQKTGHTVYCAFSAYALGKVGLTLRAAYPQAQIFFIADDDWDKPLNTGVIKALEAASYINARVYKPNFDGYQRNSSHTDFNDLCILRGSHGSN